MTNLALSEHPTRSAPRPLSGLQRTSDFRAACRLLTHRQHQPVSNVAIARQPQPLSKHSIKPIRCVVRSLGASMRRRDFLGLVGGAAATWPLSRRAAAGEAADCRVLGASTPTAQSQWTAAFVQRMRELGWVEGRTIAIEYRWAEGRTDHFAEFMAEFVRLKVDVIVTTERQSRRQSRRQRSSQSSLRWRTTQSAGAWLQVWRDPAAT